MRLREIQESFKDTMLDPAALEQDAFRGLFTQDKGICLENRIKVYRNNVVRGLSDAAIAALPMTKKLVGKDFLEQAARAYVLKNLPPEGNLNLYGITFPAFIKSYEPAAAIPYLHDFTALEWAWEAAFYADDDLPLAPEKLASLGEEDMANLGLFFRSSVFLIASNHPLDEIVDFCRSDDTEEMQTLSNRGAKLMVFRPDLKVEIRKLDDAEYDFLTLLREKKTIYEASVTISENHPNFDLTAILQKHLGLGTFTDFEVRT